MYTLAFFKRLLSKYIIPVIKLDVEQEVPTDDTSVNVYAANDSNNLVVVNNKGEKIEFEGKEI
jgi:hypothetical protein